MKNIDHDIDLAISTTLDVERGWANHPKDPGGKTMYGVTHKTLKRAYKLGIVQHNDIRALTIDEARDIYRKLYWEAVRADKLPRGLNALMFDIAVNSGPKAAVIRLQNALNYVGKFGLRVDGRIGPRTLNAVESMGRTVSGMLGLLCEVSTRRHLHWGRLGHWPTFKKGWTRRGYRLHTEAVRMAEGII